MVKYQLHSTYYTAQLKRKMVWEYKGFTSIKVNHDSTRTDTCGEASSTTTGQLGDGNK